MYILFWEKQSSFGGGISHICVLQFNTATMGSTLIMVFSVGNTKCQHRHYLSTAYKFLGYKFLIRLHYFSVKYNFILEKLRAYKG